VKDFRSDAWENFSNIVGNTPTLSFTRTEPDQAAPSATSPTSYADNTGSGISGDLAKYGFANNVPPSLINTESGGNFGATNDVTGSGGKKGHFGILQFGQDRLLDAKRAGVIPEDMTPEQFTRSKEAQVAVSNWHFSDIDKRIQSNGYDRYLGMNVGGKPLTMNGMRAIAHLGGFGGLSQFLSSGGSYNPADAYGTSLAKYGRIHS
jgi:hypothetical protein